MKHLHELSSYDKTRLLAELDGWTFNSCRGYGHVPPDLHPMTNINQDFKYKDYLTSYDAIIPLVQKLDDNIMLKIEDVLGDHLMKSCFWYRVTPSQLCDAVLVATGKATL